MTTMDARLRQLDPSPVEVARPLTTAREAMARVTSHLLSIPDSALEREWRWVGQGETDVRSGYYIAVQALNAAAGRLGMAAGDMRPATGAVASATAARWDLHGLLAPLPDEVLDSDPGGGEWTVRQTLGHTLDSQRAYAWYTAWWVGRGDTPDFPAHAPASLADGLPSEEEVASGSMADVRRRLDALLDLSIELYRDASPEQLARKARWSGFPMTAGFRIGRWAPHLEEHTVQVEKTLAMLGRSPTEVERLVRLVHRAMGRLEAAAAGSPPAALDGEAATVVEDAAAEVESIATEIAGIAAI
jgi:hypothetical protein